MKRDMDLIKDILLEIEKSKPFESIQNFEIENHEQDEILAHCEMLYERHLIKEFKPVYAYGGIVSAFVSGLTWEGCDFLETIRNDNVWNNTKKFIKDKSLPMAIDTILTISKSFIESAAKGVTEAMMNGGM